MPCQQQKRIERVRDHIFTHLEDDISIPELSKVAHYSPFHLQKLFKQLVGESPKQYSLRLRLETAFHLLIVHPQRPVSEIALDTGFSSPAVFSRAFKHQFGHAPDRIRLLPHRQQMRLLHGQEVTSRYALELPTPLLPSIRVVRKAPVKGVYLHVPFDQPEAITAAYHTLNGYAIGQGWDTSGLSGILAPHQRNTYKAFLACPGAGHIEHPFCETVIPGGAYAVFCVMGNHQQANKSAHYFLQRWLPNSGYKIRGIIGFETFGENPAHAPYHELYRSIHIPIEPTSTSGR